MKLNKYTFRTPLFGSIYCEELFTQEDGRKDLTPEQMAYLYDTYTGAFGVFLENAREDLTFAVPEELSSCIVKAEFGDYGMYDSRVYLLTHIWVEETLTEEGIEKIQEWISGQMSDGWGESLEQDEWREERIQARETYFNDDTLEFEEDYVTYFANYYMNAWNSEEFYVELFDQMEEELELEPQEVGHLQLRGVSKTVYCIPNRLALKEFTTTYHCPELLHHLDPRNAADHVYYLVKEETENSIRILPNYVEQTGPFAGTIYFNSTSPNTQESVSLDLAILALLK